MNRRVSSYDYVTVYHNYPHEKRNACYQTTVNDLI